MLDKNCSCRKEVKSRVAQRKIVKGVKLKLVRKRGLSINAIRVLYGGMSLPILFHVSSVMT